MEGIGKHHSTTHERRVRGHSLVQGLYVLEGRRCPTAPRLYRQQPVCEREQVPFQSKIDLMIDVIQSFEPVAGTLTHVLLDSWYSAKAIWKAARERGFLITTGLKCNRSLRIKDESQPVGWRWQRLNEYAASLSAEDYTQLSWPRGEELQMVYVHVISTRVRKLYSCQVIIVRRSLDDPISQARYWASSDLDASAQGLLAHISARWEIEVLFADGKEEFGLDQYQLMSATALVRFWSLALLAYAFLDEERDRLQKQWQRLVTIGETRREIQRLHRRLFILWLRQQFQDGATDESLFELLLA
jgi:DDE family transposase